MNIVGSELVRDELRQPGYFFKAVVNDSSAAFFSGKTEHRTVKMSGLSYEDNYEGNALAAIITEGRIEIRNHAAFSPARVGMIVGELLKCPELHCLNDFDVTYQGRKIQPHSP
jgi:hypothetical protein